jgi:DNA-binding NtrC family response regulator
MFYDMLQNPAALQHAPVYPQDNLINDYGKNLNPSSIVQSQPMYINQNGNDIHQHEEVEESLSIMEKEKELIIKALKKHKGKRRDASLDLGISERTLYRKLKEYDIEE